MNCSSDYLTKALDIKEIPKTIGEIQSKLASTGVKYDAIAFRGMSGALIVPSLCLALSKPMIMVRKNDNSHSCYSIEGSNPNGKSFKYIIVDDLICSGDTVRAVLKKLEENTNYTKGKCVGIFLYVRDGNDYPLVYVNSKGDEEKIMVYSCCNA